MFFLMSFHSLGRRKHLSSTLCLGLLSRYILFLAMLQPLTTVYGIQGLPGTIPINQEIISQRNKRLAIHYFNDYEPGSVEKFGILKKIITDRSQKKSFAERLHAIWCALRSRKTTWFMLSLRLCVPAPSAESRFTLDEKIFKLNRNRGNYMQSLSLSLSILMLIVVPIIVVLTKFDTLISKQSEAGKGSQESAEREFKERYGRVFETLIKNVVVPYTVVSSMCASCVASTMLT